MKCQVGEESRGIVDNSGRAAEWRREELSHDSSGGSSSLAFL